MTIIDKNKASTSEAIQTFIKQADFVLPKGFLDFFEEANGAYITSDEGYITLWSLTDMIQLNKEYEVTESAPNFFIFGTDGGGEAFAIKKDTGGIYQIPFIGMSEEYAMFICNDFFAFVSRF